MAVVRAANEEPLPGYRLLEPLGSGGFGEVWKCQAPGGFLKAIKFVGGSNHALLCDVTEALVRQELRALQYLKTLRHPFLLSVERVEVIDGELLILTELADCSLQDLLGRYQKRGLPGIPREELLEYLCEAAEVLDVMNQEHGLQHLDIKPRNLFLSGRHMKVGDFGLVGSLTELYGTEGKPAHLEMISPRYAAPERFAQQMSATSDQYSLAISYIELLTGNYPFDGESYRAIAWQHSHEEPNLGGLPEADRPAIRRALAKDPTQRFPSCLALLHALCYPGAESTRPVRALRPVTSIPPQTVEVKAKKKPLTKHDLRLGDLGATAVVPERPQSLVDTPAGERSPTEQVSAVSRQRTPPAGTDTSSADPLAGWTYLDCLGRFPYGEFWRVRPPQGPDQLVKLVFGFEPRLDRSGRDPLERLRQLKHPTLLPIEVIPLPGRLLLRSPWRDRTLVERFEEAVAEGQVGIPRRELLALLGEIADALDALREDVGLLHLGLHPRQLVLDEEYAIQMADFGLVELVWHPIGQEPAALNTRYAAPELFGGKPHAQSDQYSLALLFAELLTGAHPFRNLNQRQMATVKLRGQPDLRMTPNRDRPILQAALELDPGYRLGSCRELIDALRAASPSVEARSPGLRQATLPLPPLLRSPALHRVLRQLTEEAAGAQQVREFGQQRFLLLPGEMITHRCFARMVASTLPLKLQGFRDQWRARPIREDGVRFQYQVRFPPNLMESLLGRHPGLEVYLTSQESDNVGATLTSFHIELRPISCGRARANELLEEIGPVLLESLRKFLQAFPERRKLERLPLEQPVTLYPLLTNDEFGEGVTGQTHDVSLSGLGIYLPCPPETTAVAVHLSGPDPQGVLLEGQIVRQVACRDGRYDVGIWFGELPIG
jgi:serine/threonine protein kinase